MVGLLGMCLVLPAQYPSGHAPAPSRAATANPAAIGPSITRCSKKTNGETWAVTPSRIWTSTFGTSSFDIPGNDPARKLLFSPSLIPMKSRSTAYILLADIVNCGTTQLTNNLVLVSIQQQNSSSPCPATANSPTASGATQMTSSVQVGCNFAGCFSEGPPAISGSLVAASIAVQPYNITVTGGQPVSLSVTGAGSPTLTYQWHRNGSDITGATSATLSATSAADNGAVFTVTVSNSLGSVTSNPATLTVEAPELIN
jgi:hypothetical protein